MDFWAIHTCFFIFFLLLCPRLTMLIMGICFFPFAHPILFWLGWLATPRLVIAILATSNYWDTNPVLCIFAWMLALGGIAESKKEVEVVNNIQNRRHNRRARRANRSWGIYA